MTIKIGINGFGRMGRLSMRAAFDWDDIEIVHINDPAGNAKTLAHLMTFDSIHGRWHHEATHDGDSMIINGNAIPCTQITATQDIDWSHCDVVIEASGKIKTKALLQSYLDQGVKRVVVTAPVKEDGVLNIVLGVNENLYDKAIHPIVTAASCTTNCLAPVVKVLHEKIGIKHGSMTTIHDITNTQTILDAPHKDLRRARAGALSIIPTTTGAAKALSKIFPHLEIGGCGMRVPVPNGSLTDMTFIVKKNCTIEEVNKVFLEASQSSHKGYVAYTEDPIVSIDVVGNPASCLFDAQLTSVLGKMVKVVSWYDNEMGYSNRLADLIQKIS